MPCHVPRQTGHGEEVWQNSGPLEKRMANNFSILALRTPWIVWKGKMINTQKTKIMVSGPITSWEIDGETVEAMSVPQSDSLQPHELLHTRLNLSCTISLSLFRLMSIDAIQPSLPLSTLFLLPSVLPSIRVFSNELVFHIRWPSIGASALTSVLPMNIHGWFPLGLTGLISLLSKGLSRVFFSTSLKASILWHSTFFMDQL